jgi:hypothetical protein
MQKPNEPQHQEQQIRIEINDAVADGIYANLAFIGSNASEFVLDFARFLPGNSRGKVLARVVLAPIHAKGFLAALTDAMEKYEKTFGAVSAELAQKNIGFRINPEEKEQKSGD